MCTCGLVNFSAMWKLLLGIYCCIFLLQWSLYYYQVSFLILGTITCSKVHFAWNTATVTYDRSVILTKTVVYPIFYLSVWAALQNTTGWVPLTAEMYFLTVWRLESPRWRSNSVSFWWEFCSWLAGSCHLPVCSHNLFGEVKGEGRRESSAVSSSSYKGMSPIQLRPHPYDLYHLLTGPVSKYSHVGV